MPEVICAFICKEFAERFSDFIPEGIDGSLGGFAEPRFEFGEGHFDGIQIGGAWREIEEHGARRLGESAHGGDFMSGRIAHDDDVASSERRNQELLQPGQEDCAIHRLVDHEGRRDRAVAQSRHESRRLPTAARRLSDQSLAAKLRRPQSFVAKYENGERSIEVIEFVALARALDVAPVTLLRRFVAATGSGMETTSDPAARRRRATKKSEI
jgi:ribosome-binding protein aMBF1 (putative translation factor)